MRGNARRPMLRGLNDVANNYIIRELCIGVYACEILTMRGREALNALWRDTFRNFDKLQHHSVGNMLGE